MARAPLGRTGNRWMACIWPALVLVAASGCQSPGSGAASLPVKHSIEGDQMLVLSDLRLGSDHPLIADLVQLRTQATQMLQLPSEGRSVVVYVFEDIDRYQRYLDATYPDLPRRRAYFVGTADQLSVYTYWGERIQEDLRHEFTHGLLHASLKGVPLWLDEGIAEYFEVVSDETPPGVNGEYARRLNDSLAAGWRPDLHRLEMLEQVQHMQRVDYQESWAWVHFMLHESPASRQVLLDYLARLRESASPGPLSASLEQTMPAVHDRFLSYVRQMNGPRVQSAMY